jgi:hypothetical protein
MKTILFISLLAATLFTSCNYREDDEDDVFVAEKSLPSVVEVSNTIITISYDEQNRITKVITDNSYGNIRTILVEYSDEDKVSQITYIEDGTLNYYESQIFYTSYVGNEIYFYNNPDNSFLRFIMTLENDFPVKFEYSPHNYNIFSYDENKNLASIKRYYNDNISEVFSYAYDKTKHGIFKYSETPYWVNLFLIDIFYPTTYEIPLFSPNLLTHINPDTYPRDFLWSGFKNGFPTKLSYDGNYYWKAITYIPAN